jgi:diguanylate cyclase (GGDEF)-like protein
MSDTTTFEQHASPARIEEERLRGISRTVAEIHWLLLILVLLNMIFSGMEEGKDSLIVAAILYAVFVGSFRYTNFFKRESRMKIAIETWCMIAFITWVLWFTGKLASSMLSAYLLAVITAALTLGKLTTFFEVGLIAACYVFLGGGVSIEQLTSVAFVGQLATQLAPVLLVAYITTMFSTDIQYNLSQVQLLSETDPLTGLLNVRGFAITVNRIFAQALRNGRPACVLMIDSDNLKTVNDVYGHEAGNQLLKKLARTIQVELRHSDVPARYGGDEFIAFLPDTPSKGALQVAERIRAEIADNPLDAGGHQIDCSVSIGVASFPEDGRSIDTLVVRADHAMYEAKRQGRNRVMHSEAKDGRVHSVPMERREASR